MLWLAPALVGRRNDDIWGHQITIMKIVDIWAHQEKTPISRGYIVKEMKAKGIGLDSTSNALESLTRMGYIRRSVGTSNKTFYVQLMRV